MKWPRVQASRAEASGVLQQWQSGRVKGGKESDMRFFQRIILPAAITAVGALGAGAASAHHSAAMFDTTKPITISGTVKEFQWTNPHTWIQVSVSDGRGRTEEWSVEGGSPNSLARQGWRKTTFKPGDKVKFRIGPMRDGKPAGLFMGAVTADGQTLGQMN